MIGDRFERQDEYLEGVAEVGKLLLGLSLSDLFLWSRLENLISSKTSWTCYYGYRRKNATTSHPNTLSPRSSPDAALGLSSPSIDLPPPPPPRATPPMRCPQPVARRCGPTAGRERGIERV
uniref:Uncharacterized protein n=1 Tax=Oryza brachyantha TaxID=4533 RepID=J3MX76_ORYBR